MQLISLELFGHLAPLVQIPLIKCSSDEVWMDFCKLQYNWTRFMNMVARAYLRTSFHLIAVLVNVPVPYLLFFLPI